MQVASPIDWAATLEALIGSGVDRVLDLEFASAHWSACPARRYVMAAFTAVCDASEISPVSR